MVALDDGPDCFAKLAVVHRGLESVAAPSFAEVHDELEVHLKGLRADGLLGKGPMGTHEPQATQFDAVPPGPGAGPRRGMATAPAQRGRSAQAPAVRATGPGFGNAGTIATSSRPSGPICRPKSRSTMATACAPWSIRPHQCK